MLRLGARADDISALLGPAVSGRNYEVPEEMAADGRGIAAGQSRHDLTGHRLVGSAGRNR
jgi:copper oxidase (laccase) domain-containing protein